MEERRVLSLRSYRITPFWLFWLIFCESVAFKIPCNFPYKLPLPPLCCIVCTWHLQGRPGQLVGLFKVYK